MKRIAGFLLFLLVSIQLFAEYDHFWEVYNERYQIVQKLPLRKDETIDELIEPFRMKDNHPLKKKLDRLFGQMRVTSGRLSLVMAGFEDKEPEPATKIIVTRHREMKGYIFKIYTDDYMGYHHGEPEVFTFLRRARGAKIVRDEIVKQNLGKYYKAPQKWIYVLPATPGPVWPQHIARGYILVEEEMDLLDRVSMKKKWKDGTMTKDDLDRLFNFITRLGLRGCCKYDNVPICHDGRIAFIDTENNLRWPIAYHRFLRSLEGEMLQYWEQIIQNPEKVLLIINE